MMKISEIDKEDVKGGINLIDLGASGAVPPYWEKLAHLTNVIGFDPNKEECARLNTEESEFLSATFLPYAIAGESKSYTLYKTRNIYCWSLLQPNLSWLRRFNFSSLFEVESTEEISALALKDVDYLKDIEIDALKIDTQGLELPILKSSENILKNCILVETETGFSDNYLEETTFDQIAQYMRSNGFELFDINTNHRVPRSNNLARNAKKEQILWCEAIWLRDYCSKRECRNNITREKALKALCIYANHGCYSFGVEMALHFAGLGLLTSEEIEALSNKPSSWSLASTKKSKRESVLRGVLSLIPRRYGKHLAEQLLDLGNTPHFLSPQSRE